VKTIPPNTYVEVEFCFHDYRVIVMVDEKKWENAIAGDEGSQDSIVYRQVLPKMRAINPRVGRVFWEDCTRRVAPLEIESSKDRLRAQQEQQETKRLINQIALEEMGRRPRPKMYPIDRQPCGCTGTLPDAEPATQTAH
jgi:hypothetical protein